jgi:hypothetical protein
MKTSNLQALLVIGAVGAALAMVDLLGTAGGLAGVALMLLATILTAPAAPPRGSEGLNWWTLLAGGTALALVGVPLAIVLETPGGLLTVIGGGAVVVAAVFGMPQG